MHLKKLSRLIAVAVFCSVFAAGVARAQITCTFTNNGMTQSCIHLTAPLGDDFTNVPIGLGYNTVVNYFELSRGWIFDVAMGFTVIWVLMGGLNYMVSGNDPGKKQKAITKMTWAIIGLLILMFSGFILRTLNSAFFTS